MARVQTVDEIYGRLRRHSPWLNPNKRVDIQYAKWGIESIRGELYTRVDEDDGALRAAKQGLKTAQEAWESDNQAQPFPRSKDEPTNIHAERINKARATIRIIEEEIEVLENIINEHDRKKREEVVTRNRPTRIADLGGGKMTLCEKCGRQHLKEFDTRPVGCDRKFTDLDSDLSWHPLIARMPGLAKINDVEAYKEIVGQEKRKLNKLLREKHKRERAELNAR